MEFPAGALTSTGDRQDAAPPSQNKPSTRFLDQTGDQTNSPTRNTVQPALPIYPDGALFPHQRPDGTSVLSRPQHPRPDASSSSSRTGTAPNTHASQPSEFTIIPPGWSYASSGTPTTEPFFSHSDGTLHFDRCPGPPIHNDQRAVRHDFFSSAHTAEPKRDLAPKSPLPALPGAALGKRLAMSTEEDREDNEKEDQQQQQPPPPHRVSQSMNNQSISSTFTSDGRAYQGGYRPAQRVPIVPRTLLERVARQDDNETASVKNNRLIFSLMLQEAEDPELPREPEGLRALILTCDDHISVHKYRLRRERLPSRRRHIETGISTLQGRLAQLRTLLQEAEDRGDQRPEPDEANGREQQPPQQASSPSSPFSSGNRPPRGPSPAPDSLVAPSAPPPDRDAARSASPGAREPALRRSRRCVQLNDTFRRQGGQRGHGDAGPGAGGAHCSQETTTGQGPYSEAERSGQSAVRARDAGLPGPAGDEDDADGFEEVELPDSERHVARDEGWEEEGWEDLGSEHAPQAASQDPPYRAPRPGFMAPFLPFPQTKRGL